MNMGCEPEVVVAEAKHWATVVRDLTAYAEVLSRVASQVVSDMVTPLQDLHRRTNQLGSDLIVMGCGVVRPHLYTPSRDEHGLLLVGVLADVLAYTARVSDVTLLLLTATTEGVLVGDIERERRSLRYGAATLGNNLLGLARVL